MIIVRIGIGFLQKGVFLGGDVHRRQYFATHAARRGESFSDSKGNSLLNKLYVYIAVSIYISIYREV